MGLTASSRAVPGSLKQEILVDGRHRLVTDEPVSVGGDGSAAAPHELLPAALAGCVSTMIVMYARTKALPLEDVVVDVDYDHKATPRTYDVRVHLTGDLSAEQVARLEKVAATCPVKRALEAGAHVVERVELHRPARAA